MCVVCPVFTSCVLICVDCYFHFFVYSVLYLQVFCQFVNCRLEIMEISDFSKLGASIF